MFWIMVVMGLFSRIFGKKENKKYDNISDAIRAAEAPEELGLKGIKMSPRMAILKTNREQYENNQRVYDKNRNKTYIG